MSFHMAEHVLRHQTSLALALLVAATACSQVGESAQQADRPVATEHGKDQQAQTMQGRLQQFLEKRRSDDEKASKPPLPGALPENRGDPAAPPSPDAGLVDQPTRNAYLAALRGYYNYRLSGLEHRQRVFQWQLWSSKVIFTVVLILVGAGIYFAAMQFHRGFMPTAEVSKAERRETTEFVATLSGIKVSSPVLGVITLVISLVFFYLYLVFVYPIHEVF